ncbi:MAG TPA: hypothetical protein VGR92_23565 [Steroidobacteraceae bacterium]|nr:hypothetical protein [Steroidobacteraceae bacterium]
MRMQRAARAAGQLRRMTWSVVCVLPLCGVPAGVWAQNVPAGLRACTAETDSARRLACYDREMARLAQPPAPPAPSAAAPSPPKPDLATSPATAAPAPAAPAAPAPTATAMTPPPAAAPTAAASAPHHSWVGKIFGGGSSARVTARIAGLERSPNAMVLHLANGQVWQQIGRASGDLTLEVGDSVTIEKHLGSYWLSASHVSDMQVRLRSQ